jgi:acetoin utilization deacetylase AcuC-like enzyme
MTCFCFYHPANEAHDPGPDHSERAARLTGIVKAIRDANPPNLVWQESPKAAPETLTLAHTPEYIDFLFKAVPESGYREIEPRIILSEHDDGEVTVLCPASGEAILRSVGGALAAVDAVMSGATQNAFCLARPPGHHALPDKAMGFCAANTVAIAARYAQKNHNLNRIAIVDFDVHHGNGTQGIFCKDVSVFFASIHQLPLWPESGHADETGLGNILNVPIKPETPREEWLKTWQEKILARLESESFDFLFVSAGFDAHKNDPKGGQNLETEDYATLTKGLMDIAAKKCTGRLVVLLEGGYDIAASAASATTVAQTLGG